MPRSDDLRSPPYRAPHANEPREPWLERLGWGDDPREEAKVASQGAIVAVHIAWGDQALSITHLAEDGDCDPWHGVGAGAGEGIHVAVRVRHGSAVFFFADDPSSRVEGPSGELRLDALREEGLVTRVSADRYAIAMEPGVLYRTRRFGLTVTAEIVARPARLAPPKRLAKLAVYAGLFLAAFAVGAMGNAFGEGSDPMIEAHADHRDEETLARLLASAAAEAAGRPMLPSEASHAAPDRYRVVSPFQPLCSFVYPCRMPRPWLDYAWAPSNWFRDLERWERIARGDSLPRRVRPRWVTSDGELPRASIARVIRRNVTFFDECANRDDSAGTVQVRFVIGGDGFVLGANVVESSLQDGAVSRCIAREMRRLVFAAPRGGGVVVGTSVFVVAAAARTRQG